MKVDPDIILDACINSNTMTEAHRKVCKIVKIKFCTFVKYAKSLNCYNPNQGSKGIVRKYKKHVSAYLGENGLFTTSHKLKLMLIRDGLKEHKCEICNIREWRNEPVPIELDHIDGDHLNNELNNLRIICPNCHAQTDTNSGRKNKKPR